MIIIITMSVYKSTQLWYDSVHSFRVADQTSKRPFVERLKYIVQDIYVIILIIFFDTFSKTGDFTVELSFSC